MATMRKQRGAVRRLDEANHGERRPIRARSSAWAAAAATWLTRAEISPNAISLAGLAAAALGAGAFALAAGSDGFPRAAWLVMGIIGVQLRLVANLLDGMVAIEGGQQTAAGEVFNDVPDRVSDALILVAAGYAAGTAWGPELGWTAAILAVMTAYVRMLGSSLGIGGLFDGPMAKPHRMVIVVGACLFAAGEAILGIEPRALTNALLLIVAGCVVTIAGRLRRIAGELDAR